MKMNKNRISIGLAVILLCMAALPALAQSTPTIESILSAQAIKAYTDEEVSKEDIDLILAAGAKAPSARNLQPWRFIVVRDEEIVSALSRNGGVVILIAGQQAGGAGMNVDFDCGLTTQNMYLAAQALGLGANITMSPVAAAQRMADTLGIPDGYEVIMALTIGHYENDAISGATTRNAVSDITTYIP